MVEKIHLIELNKSSLDFENLSGNICIAGDFNIALSGFAYPSHKARNEINEIFEISYRTRRIDFVIVEKIISILSVRSGYSPEDLKSSLDEYKDKKLHQKFNQMFN